VTATLARRLEALEAMLPQVSAVGCDRCASLPEYPMEWVNPDDATLVPCLTMGGPCPGCARCQARSGWPEGYRCPSCGRGPVQVITIAYRDGDAWRGKPSTATTAMPSPAPEPEREPPAPAERTPEAVLAEVQAQLAALKASIDPEPEPEPEPAPPGAPPPPATKPLRGWGPTQRHTSARSAIPLRYGWR
jgi:hypothetical protein